MIRGASYTIDLIFNAEYTTTRVSSMILTIGNYDVCSLAAGSIVRSGQHFMCSIPSDVTAVLPVGERSVTLTMNDTTDGVRKVVIATVPVQNTGSQYANESVSETANMTLELTYMVNNISADLLITDVTALRAIAAAAASKDSEDAAKISEDNAKESETNASQSESETLALKNTVQGLHDTVVADAAQVALDRIATGEDAAQTALDRIATGQDAQTATTKAGEASDSAASALQSKNYASGYADDAEEAKTIALANNEILGGIAYNAAAPTPGKSGKYYFTTAGSCTWLTGGSASVLIGQEVLVVYTAPSTYVYTLLAVTANYALSSQSETGILCMDGQLNPFMTIKDDGTIIIKTGQIYIYLKDALSTRLITINSAADATITLTHGQTLCIDISKCVVGGVVSYLTAFATVSFGAYPSTHIPICNYRSSAAVGMYVYHPFLRQYYKYQLDAITSNALVMQNSITALQNNETILYKQYSNNKLLMAPNYHAVQYGRINNIDGVGTSWAKRVNLIHISDSHVSGTNEALNVAEASMLATDSVMGVDAVINTGDFSNGNVVAKSTVLAQYDAFKTEIVKSSVPSIAILGNHDSNNGDTNPIYPITKAEQWSHLFSFIATKYTSIVWGNSAGNRSYGYLDIVNATHGTVRVIFLDMLDHDNPQVGGVLTYTGMYQTIYSQAQIDWLCGTALNVADGYKIVIANHFPFAAAGTYNEDTPVLNDGTFVQGWTLVPNIIKAWQERTTIAGTYNDTVGTQNITVNADFSAIGVNCEFICFMCGHTHSKNKFTVTGYNQLMLCEDSSGQVGTALNKSRRIADSQSSNAFSILSIDTVEKKVYRTAFGHYLPYTGATVERTQSFDYILT